MTPPGELVAIYQDRPRSRSNRLLSLGIVVVGLGLALTMLIGFASRDANLAAGIGGAITIIGAAFIVTAYVVHGQGRRDEPMAEPRPRVERVAPPAPPPSPPSSYES
jgi:peptidoglycan/LPS O-acetylase OafA/YrhL